MATKKTTAPASKSSTRSKSTSSSKSSASSAKKAASSSKAPAKKAPAKKAPAKKGSAASKTPAKKGSAASKTPAKKAPAKKGTAASKTPAKKGTAASKAPAKKAPAKKGTAASKAPAKKAPAKKAPAKKAPAKKAPAKKAPAKKAPAKKAPAKKAPAKKVPAASKAPAKKAPTKPTAEEKPKPASRRKVSKYSVGDKVVHPQHGAATIGKKLKQEFAGVKKDYFVLDIATEQLTVMVPVDTIEEVIRPIISKTQARKVLGVLKDEPQEAGSNWSRWYKVLNEKMTSGDIFQVAEVVRDLNFAQQTKGISPALKRMLSKARVTLTSELEFSLEISDEDAVKRLDRALPKFEPPEE